MCSTAADGALAALDAALDALAAEDAPVGDAARLARVRRLSTARNRLDAALTGAVREADAHLSAEHDGLKTMPSWLRGHTRMSGAEAGRLVGQGRALQHLPAVEAAFVAGLVTADQVDVVAEVVRPENLDRATAQDIDLAVIESALLTIATGQPYRELQKAVGSYLARLDPDGAEPDPTGGRSLVLAQHPDGTVTGALTLDQVGGEKVMTTLEAIVAAGRSAGDTRSRAQRHADALVQLCDLALASGQVPVLRTVKPHLVITIPLADLADPTTGHGVATTGTGALISAARARWAACDASITRVVLDPDGQPLDVGRTQRLVPPHLRRALEVRDQGCVFTGCAAPTWWCDAHHLLEWIDGGQTSLGNSALLCERHHTKVHHGFRVERQPDGRWRTWRPDGTEIALGPARTWALAR